MAHGTLRTSSGKSDAKKSDASQGQREHVRCRLGHGVNAEAGRGLEAQARRDIDDRPTPAPLEPRNGKLRYPEGIQQIVRDLRSTGIGILVTDHNVRETLSVTDRAYIINEGRIFRTGTPEQLGNDPEVKRVYLGESFSLV